MNNIIFQVPVEYTIFKDCRTVDCYYAIKEDVLKYKTEVVNKFGNKEKDVPDNYKIKAFSIKYFKMIDNNKIYQLDVDDSILILINQIEWIKILVLK